MGIGSVTFSLPHFLTGPYRVRGSEGLNSTSDNICKAPSLLDQADRDTILQNIPGLQKIKSLVNSEGKKLGRGCFQNRPRKLSQLPKLLGKKMFFKIES